MLAICGVFACLGLSACDEFRPQHKHKFVENASDEYLKSEATCTERATYYKSCSCGEKGTEIFEYGNELGHNYGDIIAEVAATCTEGGVKAHYHCSRCDKDFNESKVETTAAGLTIAALGHNYGDIIPEVAPTCTKKGVEAHYHCSRCDKDFNESKVETTAADLAIAALEHDYGDWVQDDGTNTHTKTCSRNVTHKITETCADTDNDHYCNDCGGQISSCVYNNENATDKYLASDATCTKKATYYKSCSCGEKGTETFEYGNARGHNYGTLIDEAPATCSATGLAAHYYCSACKTYFDSSKQKTTLEDLTIAIDEDNHDYKDGVCSACGGLKGSEGMSYTLLSDGTYSVTNMGTCADSAVVIPSNINGIQVTSIGSSAFKGNKALTSIVIPNSVKSIGDLAFSECTNLASVTTHGGTQKAAYRALRNSGSSTSIGDSAFSGCETLTEVDIPDGVTTIGEYAFKNCSNLSSVTIPDGVISIGANAFHYCIKLTSVIIPDGVTSISDQTFYCCTSLASVTMPSGLKSIGAKAFYSCESLVDVVIPDGVTSIGVRAFDHCGSLESIVIPDGVTSIGEATFSCCGLASVIIPNSVTSIGDWAFSNCSSLTSIILPAKVESITKEAFRGCGKLIEVINNSNLTITAGSEDNGYVAYYAKFVHSGASKIATVDDYLFATIDGVNYLLGYVGAATELTLPVNYNGEKYQIYGYAFGGFSTLTSIIIRGGVTKIGEHAFSSCTSLTSVTMPDGVTDIGNNAFSYCESLESIVIPDSVTSLGEWAFMSCTSLKSIVIPDGVTSIGAYTFDWCLSLTSVTIGNGVKSIDVYAFAYCPVTNIIIPDGVTSIGMYAFSYCESLESIVIPSSVTSIGHFAFYAVSHVKVYYAGNESAWNNLMSDYRNDYHDVENVGYEGALFIHYYSESKPTELGDYWHYVDGVPTAW